jgi:hypothetical protein
MKYYKGSTTQFDAMRAIVMTVQGMPNGHADEPWPVGITKIALSPHHYEPPQYVALIEQALASGIEEITEAEYLAE